MISVKPETYIDTLKEPVKSVTKPARYGPIICPMLNEDVKIAVETIKDPENLFCPSSKLRAEMGTNLSQIK